MDFASRLAQYEPKPMDQKRVYAVCLPLIQVGNDWHVLYELRSQAISQPGEVSFPGGAVEEDESLREAAIRETVEELQILTDEIEILGEIDYIVHPGRTVHCFVGQLHVADWTRIVPNEEVERLFTVPLAHLLESEPKYYCLETVIEKDSDFPFDRIQNGVDYKFSHYQRQIPFYECLPENIWGMTAQFTHRFTELMKNQVN